MKLLYFARVREDVGTSEEDLSLPAEIKTAGDLLAHLRGRGDNYTRALEDMNRIRIAVNEVYVDLDHPVCDSDEVAVFPPMTGG
ncbi:molybdopterin converting factor subunit 1 [Emcibacter nanhaiensis]|uniref:Molybdopterin synthase sulfur carrier subunit n=1 Tax=Emcibacter nanhaiensis TaxID=1505037 RepID=A0A501PH66_9PROT|nr:molybdopterin converting factor subunit 1 [Emcibacter nanhaiensis]TPD59418.1 molybdopterin converting factor subunit 1 [Emcibacter nanhaiensis]